jgi:hypothetical protein
LLPAEVDVLKKRLAFHRASAERNVTPAENRIAADAGSHLAFDPFLVLQHFFPIDLGLTPEHDSPDERICAVR